MLFKPKCPIAQDEWDWLLAGFKWPAQLKHHTLCGCLALGTLVLGSCEQAPEESTNLEPDWEKAANGGLIYEKSHNDDWLSIRCFYEQKGYLCLTALSHDNLHEISLNYEDNLPNIASYETNPLAEGYRCTVSDKSDFFSIEINSKHGPIFQKSYSNGERPNFNIPTFMERNRIDKRARPFDCFLANSLMRNGSRASFFGSAFIIEAIFQLELEAQIAPDTTPPDRYIP